MSVLPEVVLTVVHGTAPLFRCCTAQATVGAILEVLIRTLGGKDDVSARLVMTGPA